ncbi:MAG: transcriptional regulator [Phenylobacterium sp.]|uniref:ROK family protein n=1 Tax=Phenylobacterium sp. TaxID=1871053 RepID=UPI0025F6132F|nr:ROK family protein [Phenylobacterium sp.]MBA4012389.1 transcriptional regulator [Phenylobacterium sp.]
MIRIGVDFGGTKIEAAALDAHGRFQARVRGASPRDYAAGLEAVRELVAEAERQAGVKGASIGVGGPGSPSPASGLMRNANSTELNGHPFPADLARVLERPVRYANDANCLALSEATDGAGAEHRVVFAAILGTGCGAGVAVERSILEGRNAFAGEWGHMPLPWPTAAEHPGPSCWCGRRGCMELWVSGPGFSKDHGGGLSSEQIVGAARNGEHAAAAALERYVDRLARGLAVVCDVLDPDVIVLGGGMSNVGELYDRLPGAIAPLVFSDLFETEVRPAMHGDSSGVRGAAWLWPLQP